MSEGRENRLATEASPYLRQHRHDPVDWFPWGDEAFRRAREAERPILLSVGYAACHWCHVMEHDAFSVDEVAERMNRSFVSVKVDREERPDVDELYQGVVQLMGRSGGWPLTVFLTPDGKPFFGGTYFPPNARFGLPGFSTVLDALADAWKTRRGEVTESADSFAEGLGKMATFGLDQPGMELTGEDLQQAARAVAKELDPLHGGFGGAPKFPNPMDLAFLLRTGAGKEGVSLTLGRMAKGGIHDQLGGGFHRYAVDERWAVPHFEKMLYDNALLVRLYAEASVALGEPALADVAREIFSWMKREMTAPGGGFYSSQDADSESEEGKYFVWTPGELKDVLGAEDGALLAAHLGVTAGGNFEGGGTVLHVARSAQELSVERSLPLAEVERRIAEGKRRLLEARQKRVAPETDDKILAGWNGLAIGGLAAAGRILSEPAMIEAARRAADFVLRTHAASGELLRVHREGVTKQPAFLDDEAHLAEGLIELFESTGESRWLAAAQDRVRALVARFWDEKKAVFYLSPATGEALLHRQPSLHDNAVPAGGSTATMALLRMNALTGDETAGSIAARNLSARRESLLENPLAFGHLWCAAWLSLQGVIEVAVIGREGPARTALLQAARRGFHPEILAFEGLEGPGAVEGKREVDGRPAAYVCRNFACEAPRQDPAELGRALGLEVG